MSNKYGAIRHKFNGITFDSALELNTYVALSLVVGSETIKVHYPIEISPATKRFPKWSWKVDFYLTSLDFYVESKGVRTSEWMNKLRAIDALKPEVLSKLLIVSEKGGEKVCKGLSTVTINDCVQLLQALLVYRSKNT